MTMKGTSLLGQELRLSAAPARGKDSILDLELSFPHAMWCGKKKKKKKKGHENFQSSFKISRQSNLGYRCAFSSVQLSRSVVFNSLRPHGLQHARPPCPTPTPRVC